MLFVVGINIGLRAGDLLNLKIKDVFQANKIVDRIVITEEKTDKKRDFEINKSAKSAILLYIDTLKDVAAESY